MTGRKFAAVTLDACSLPKAGLTLHRERCCGRRWPWVGKAPSFCLAAAMPSMIRFAAHYEITTSQPTTFAPEQEFVPNQAHLADLREFAVSFTSTHIQCAAVANRSLPITPGVAGLTRHSFQAAPRLRDLGRPTAHRGHPPPHLPCRHRARARQAELRTPRLMPAVHAAKLLDRPALAMSIDWTASAPTLSGAVSALAARVL